jgi:hypothetical protein
MAQSIDIRETLPPAVRQKLLPGEPAYAYVRGGGGCGTNPSSLLVTDTRVIVEGSGTQRQGGCGSSSRSLEIPIAHVSAVSEESAASGCNSSSAIAISSGSAVEKLTVGNKKELQGALRIIQALVRAAHGRR